MKQLIINVGPSGCGKTTWTTEFLKTHPDYVRINRDDIRRVLFGEISSDYYERPGLNERESKVTSAETVLALTQAGGRNQSGLVIDNTNLKPEYLKKWIDYCSSGDKPEIEAKIKIFEAPLPMELKIRVAKRDNKKVTDLIYIDRQYAQYQEIVRHINKNYKDHILS